MVWKVYDQYREGQMDSRQVDMDAITGFIAIIANAYVPNQNTHEFFSDVINQVVGTGYTADGNALATPILSMDAAGLITFDIGDPAIWPQNAAGFTNGRRFVLYDKTGAAAANWRLIAFSDPEVSDFGNVSGPLTVMMDPLGVFTQAR